MRTLPAGVFWLLSRKACTTDQALNYVRAVKFRIGLYYYRTLVTAKRCRRNQARNGSKLTNAHKPVPNPAIRYCFV